MSRSKVDTFRSLMQRSAGGKIVFRQVDKFANGLLLHLPPAAANQLERKQMPTELASFLQEAPAEYFAGVRVQDAVLGRPLCCSAASSYHRCRFTFAEMFAGIGGFCLGLEPLGGTCVIASEIDSAACQTYRTNHGSHSLIGDITSVYGHELPDFEILVGGFPCQSFSQRGEQSGISDERGQLYQELVRLLNSKKPKAFLFENVAGLVEMDGGLRNRRGEPTLLRPGRTFQRILQSFQDCGYNVSWRVVNSRHWLPQYRERVYIVGFRSDLQKDMDWALCGEQVVHKVRDILESPDSPSVLASELSPAQWCKVQGQSKAMESLGARSIPLDDKAPTLISSYHCITNFASKYICEERDGTMRHGSDKLPRFLTPRECCRLMGFPESFTVPEADCSEHMLGGFYRQIGNAVCPPVIRSIGDNIVAVLKGDPPCSLKTTVLTSGVFGDAETFVQT